jgi:hypothetical protein
MVKMNYKITNNMKAKLFFLMLILVGLTTGCENELESGKDYPILEMGNSTIVYKIDKVTQNDIDIKSYLGFFDQVELTLEYKDSKPTKLTFAETGVPFRITSIAYTDKIEFEWEIDTSKSPYEIRDKATGKFFCYLTKERQIIFPFTLGCPSNKYEYQLTPVSK